MSMTETAQKVFPYYLSIGCTYETFWNAPAWVIASYRNADVYRRERENYNAWLQGLYVYRGVKSAVDTFAWGFGGKKGQRPDGYPEQRLAITEREQEQDRQQRIAFTRRFFAEGQNK